MTQEETCLFCQDTRVTETHHVIPRRFNGKDTDQNTITVCPSCHRILESLYNKQFYKAVGTFESDQNTRHESRINALTDVENIIHDYIKHIEFDAFKELTKEIADELYPESYYRCIACFNIVNDNPCPICSNVNDKGVVPS